MAIAAVVRHPEDIHPFPSTAIFFCWHSHETPRFLCRNDEQMGCASSKFPGREQLNGRDGILGIFV
jgi:hypothetical protein